jgi:lipid-A-disaccharide synthase-like uncharacterized protein
MSLFRNHLESLAPWLYVDSSAWTGLGFFGTMVFGSRFFVQWIHSERTGRLVVPSIFWHLSFWGSLISLMYALHLDKMPIILGQAFLPILYGRNLWLLSKR